MERGLKNVALKIMFDYVILYGFTSEQMLAYFRTVMYVLKHHHATLILK